MKLFTCLITTSIVATILLTPTLGIAQVALQCPDGKTRTAGEPCPIPGKTILGDVTNPSGSSLEGVITLLNTITNWLFTFLLIFAVIMFIYAAYLYLFSGGSEEATGKAKNYLIYGVVGIAVAMLAKGVTFIVYQLLK